MGLAAAFSSSPAAAEGPWSIEPRLGVAGDYISNPLLRERDVHAEEDIAGLFDLPLRYDADNIDFMLRPSGRRSNRQGFSSLASNYEHLDAAFQVVNEVGSTSLQGQLARDSSLYYVGALVNGTGVARDTAAVNADWSRSVTARNQVQLDASWTRVRYVESDSVATLTDYRYVSGGPTVSTALSERDTVKLTGTYGLYQSLNRLTESRSENLQLAFVRQLTEIWLLSTSAGYSRSANSQKVYETFYFGTFYLGEEKSNQNGAVYAATLTRRGQRLNLSVSASRALQPTGFAFLSRQDNANLSASYARNELWDFGASALWSRAANPQIGARGVVSGTQSATRYLNMSLTANWHVTPQWTVSVNTTRIMQQYAGPPSISAGSINVGVNLTRQFLRTQF